MIEIPYGRIYDKIWLIQKCTNCQALLLKERHIIEYEEPYEEFKILYPQKTTTLSGSIPIPVMNIYAATLKLKAVPNAFALLAAHTLEAACRYEQAQGKSLNEKLNYLAENKRIPKTLAEMAHQVRELRNIAVHDAENEVTVKDVPIILEFLEAILEYLYVAPAKIEAVQKRLTRLTPPENAGKEK